jgi:cytochrome c peroxidase
MGLIASSLVPLLAQSGRSQRLEPGPTLSPAEYAWLAQTLRADYSKPAARWPRPTLDKGVALNELSLLPEPSYPPGNRPSPRKQALGKQLFFDPRLSASGQISCASCHDPDLSWADGRTVAFGHDRSAGRRNAPSIMNAAYNTSHFWDGRAASLEQQASSPIVDPIEMNADAGKMVARLNAIGEYRKEFKEVFGADSITLPDIARAIADFERTLRGGRSRFDAFLKGKTDALSDSAVRGLHLFRTSARCLNCHNGPNFTDGQFHDLGLSYYGRKYEDLGRYRITHRPEDVGRFKTPTLRNVTRTAPYMHNGLFNLEGVLRMYNAGMATLRRKPSQMHDPLFPTKDPLLQPLGLNPHDLEDLLAFLKSLEEPHRRVRPPELPR